MIPEIYKWCIACLPDIFLLCCAAVIRAGVFFKVEGSNGLHEQNLREDLTLTLLKRSFSMLKKLCVDKNICIPLVKHYVFECEVSLNCIHFKTLNFTLNKNSSESILFFHWEFFPPWKFPIFFAATAYCNPPMVLIQMVT